MYCENCGQKAKGNFCKHCGYRLDGHDAPAVEVKPAEEKPVEAKSTDLLPIAPPPTEPVMLEVLPLDAGPMDVLPIVAPDWWQEVEYAKLIKIPAVKDLLAQCASSARKSMSGEQFLEIYDKVFSPGVSLKKVAEITCPIYDNLGIRTGKTQTGYLALPPGRVIVAVLCGLARNGRAIKEVHQCSDGCIVHAKLPSDLLSLEGELVVSIRKHGPGMQIEAATRIPGQWFDWGKSQRCLNNLFEELRAAA